MGNQDGHNADNKPWMQVDADRTLGTMLSVMLPQLRLDSHAIKLQINEGGHCLSTSQLLDCAA